MAIHKLIGPFQFLALSLIASESLMGWWMYLVHEHADSYERIVIGSLSIAILIAIIVVFCIVYYIKRRYDELAYGDYIQQEEIHDHVNNDIQVETKINRNAL